MLRRFTLRFVAELIRRHDDGKIRAMQSYASTRGAAVKTASPEYADRHALSACFFEDIFAEISIRGDGDDGS
jgi:hypothetical protein